MEKTPVRKSRKLSCKRRSTDDLDLDDSARTGSPVLFEAHETSITPTQPSKSRAPVDDFSPVYMLNTQESQDDVDVIWDWSSPQAKPTKYVRKQKRLHHPPPSRTVFKKHPSNGQLHTFDKIKEEMEALKRGMMSTKETEEESCLEFEMGSDKEDWDLIEEDALKEVALKDVAFPDNVSAGSTMNSDGSKGRALRNNSLNSISLKTDALELNSNTNSMDTNSLNPTSLKTNSLKTNSLNTNSLNTNSLNTNSINTNPLNFLNTNFSKTDSSESNSLKSKTNADINSDIASSLNCFLEDDSLEEQLLLCSQQAESKMQTLDAKKIGSLMTCDLRNFNSRPQFRPDLKYSTDLKLKTTDVKPSVKPNSVPLDVNKNIKKPVTNANSASSSYTIINAVSNNSDKVIGTSKLSVKPDYLLMKPLPKSPVKRSVINNVPLKDEQSKLGGSKFNFKQFCNNFSNKSENCPSKSESCPNKFENSSRKLENSLHKLENSSHKFENSSNKLENSSHKLGRHSINKLKNEDRNMADDSFEQALAAFNYEDIEFLTQAECASTNKNNERLKDCKLPGSKLQESKLPESVLPENRLSDSNAKRQSPLKYSLSRNSSDSNMDDEYSGQCLFNNNNNSGDTAVANYNSLGNVINSKNVLDEIEKKRLQALAKLEAKKKQNTEMVYLSQEKNQQQTNPLVINQQTINQQKINQQTINQQTINQQTINHQTINQQTVNQQTHKRQTIVQQTLPRESLKQEAPKQATAVDCETSPIKCSPEEIELKRLQALAKLQAKKKQEIIEKNRLEALKRLEMNKRKRTVETKSTLPRRTDYAI